LRPSDSQKNWLGKMAERYHESLDEKTLSYLADRGLGPDVVTGARLGLVVAPDGAHAQYEGRLSIPYLTPTGVVSMRFRCLDDHGDLKCNDLHHGKYESISGDETRLYNVSALHLPGDAVGICEGELDALVATNAGLPSVGCPGINNWKPFYYRLFEDYDRVIVLGDGDDAGRKFVATLTRALGNGIRKPLPNDHDVTSYVVEHGVDRFRDFVGGVA
jgi:hypothetical protein